MKPLMFGRQFCVTEMSIQLSQIVMCVDVFRIQFQRSAEDVGSLLQPLFSLRLTSLAARLQRQVEYCLPQ